MNGKHRNHSKMVEHIDLVYPSVTKCNLVYIFANSVHTIIYMLKIKVCCEWN